MTEQIKFGRRYIYCYSEEAFRKLLKSIDAFSKPIMRNIILGTERGRIYVDCKNPLLQELVEKGEYNPEYKSDDYVICVGKYEVIYSRKEKKHYIKVDLARFWFNKAKELLEK